MSYRRTPRATRWIAGLLVTVLTALGVAGGLALNMLRGPQYEATTDVLVQFWSIDAFLLTGQGSPVQSEDVADAATLATSRDVLDDAERTLDDGRTGAELAHDVTATPQLTSHAVEIVATADDPEAARRLSAAVAAGMTKSVQQRIAATASSLAGTSTGDFPTLLQQRAQVLSGSVQPLQVLTTQEPVQTAPTLKLPLALGVVGLAAGVLLMIGMTFARPTIARSRDAQRLVELPAVPFARPSGGPDATRVLRRILDTRPTGSVLVVPVDADAEKPARVVADWARSHTRDAAEAQRVVSTPEPAGAVLDPRPGPDDVAAVVLVCPRGTARRALTDAVALLGTWRRADAVVVCG